MVTFEMAVSKVEKGESEIRELGKQMADIQIQKSHIKDGTIFDEDKSVRWNRDEVVRRRRSLDGKYGALKKKEIAIRDDIYDTILQYTMDEYHFPEEVARVVYNSCEEREHSGGFMEILNSIGEAADFAYKIIEAYTA